MKKRFLIPILSLLVFALLLCGCDGNKYTEGLSFVTYNGEDGYYSVSGGGKTHYTTVKIPDTYDSWLINRIDQNAFYGCESLSEINIPNTVIIISAGAFMGCRSLTQISLPSGLKAIGADSFLNSGLTEIVFPDITELGSQSFATCAYLKSVEFSDSLEEIQNRAFLACIRLESLYLPKNLKTLGPNAFESCVMLSSVTLPPSLESIGTRAFYGCTALTSVAVPASVTSIENGAFEGCTALTSVTLSPDFVVSYYAFDFSPIQDELAIYVPESLLEDYKSAEGWSALADRIVAIEE